MRVLLVDNRDSFTFNLEHLLAESGASVRVAPYDDLSAALDLEADLLVISPGPGHPRDYSAYGTLRHRSIPVLGVCLGMQILNHLEGGEVSRLSGCVHGKTDTVTMAGQRFTVARYHSLFCARVAAGFEVVARTDRGVPMAIRHRARPWLGLQFHPESYLTPDGGWFVRHAFDALLAA